MIGGGWKAVRKVADAHESRIRRAVVSAVHTGQDALNVEAIELGFETNTPTLAEAAIFEASAVMGTIIAVEVLAEVRATFEAGANAALRSAQIAGSFRAARNVKLGAMSFSMTNPEAVRWLQEHGGELVTGITKTTQQAIARILIRSFREGIPTREAARLIRPLIGLTEGHADAVFNLREAIRANPGKKIWAGRSPIRVPRGGATADFVARRSQQYASRLLNFRANMIARTEAITASNMGQQHLWQQAMEQGLITSEQTKEWIVTPDDRLCPICEELGGEVQLVEDSFSVGVPSPPAHALCRCTMGLSSRRVRQAA
jgi:SPP1 gp7 family putative phage head morphogenesis protein